MWSEKNIVRNLRHVHKTAGNCAPKGNMTRRPSNRQIQFQLIWNTFKHMASIVEDTSAELTTD